MIMGTALDLLKTPMEPLSAVIFWWVGVVVDIQVLREREETSRIFLCEETRSHWILLSIMTCNMVT